MEKERWSVFECRMNALQDMMSVIYIRAGLLHGEREERWRGERGADER